MNTFINIWPAFLFLLIFYTVYRTMKEERKRSREVNDQFDAFVEQVLRETSRRAEEALHEAAQKMRQPPPKLIGPHWKVLGIAPTRDKNVIQHAFKKAALKAHPDQGGSNDKFVKLHEARKAALREIGHAA